MPTNEMVIGDYEPCPEWEPMEADDLPYCNNCGGQWITHEPQLSQTFDMMNRM